MNTTVHAPAQSATNTRAGTAGQSEGRFEWERAFRTAALPGTPNRVRMARLTGMLIASYASRDGYVGPEHSPSLFTLADSLGLSREDRRPVVEAVSLLTSLGWLEKESGGGRRVRNAYQLTVPAAVDEGAEESGNRESSAVNGEDFAANREDQGSHHQIHSTHNNPSTPAAAGAGVGGSHSQKNKSTIAGAGSEERGARAYPSQERGARSGQTVQEALGEERFTQFAGALEALRDHLDGEYPGGEGTKLYVGIRTLAKRVEFATEMLRLFEAGWTMEVWAELTRCETGFRTPYAGADNPAAVAWSRLKFLGVQVGTAAKAPLAADGLTTNVSALVATIGRAAA